MKRKNIIYLASSITLLASCNTIKNKPLTEEKSNDNLQSIDVAYLNNSIIPKRGITEVRRCKPKKPENTHHQLLTTIFMGSPIPHL